MKNIIRNDYMNSQKKIKIKNYIHDNKEIKYASIENRTR